MRLRRSVVRGPGLRRVRRGRGFSYHNPDGTAVTDAVALQRINDLVIPPAWKNVWICPHPRAPALLTCGSVTWADGNSVTRR